MKLLTIWSISFSCLVFSPAAAEENSPFAVFELQDLVSPTTGSSDTRLADSLASTGLVAVRAPSPANRQQALQGLCHCQPSLLSMKDSVDRVELTDGTWRTTVGAGTAGQTPLALPEDLKSTCGSTTTKAMEALRDDVATVTNAFVTALDRLLLPGVPLLRNKYQGSYDSVASIQAAANHLEHFHVYSKSESSAVPQEEESATLDWHLDAGLFLTFVPAVDCSSSTPDESFYLPNVGRVQFPSDVIVIMLGAGAQHWLDTSRSSVSLKATRHAVQMKRGQVRAWYGMMTLVPDIALVEQNPPRTFQDMKKQMSLISSSEGNEETTISIGCGHHEDSKQQRQDDPQEEETMTSRGRRRMQHVESAAACNNNTNFFCWMQCMSIPDSGNIDTNLEDGLDLYCMDPSILASGFTLLQAVTPCADATKQNPSCTGQWANSSHHVTAYDLGRHVNTSDTGSHDNTGDTGALTSSAGTEEPYCFGVTTMSHEGFFWTNTVCLVYLFPGWILTTKGKLAAACVGTLVLGIFLEYILSQRRHVLGRLSSRNMRLLATALFYGIQLTLGYFLMLVIMTYSGPLFLCTIMGLVIGNICFVGKDAFFASMAKHTSGDDATDEDKKVSEEHALELDEAGDRAKNEDKNSTSSESELHGITPCCQNAV